MPVGTGTLFVKKMNSTEAEEANCPQMQQQQQQPAQSAEDEDYLHMEKSGLNVTQREESLVVQYLTLGGHANYWTSQDRQPSLACSGVHAGPGQLSFGWNRRQRADLTLMFDKTAQQPAVVFAHNYHELGVHYRGHDQFGCPRYMEREPPVKNNNVSIRPSKTKRGAGGSQKFWQQLRISRRNVKKFTVKQQTQGALIYDAETRGADHFKRQLAETWSLVRPRHVIFYYSTSTACDFFHGQNIYGARDGGLVDTDLTNLLKFEFEADCRLTPQQVEENKCKIFVRPPRYTQAEASLLSTAQLKRDIVSGVETGFVTVLGGRENRPSQQQQQPDASDHFGFCVQSFACTQLHHLSAFTKNQIAQQQGWELPRDVALLEAYLEKQPARTLNSTTFHTEETVSTSYLAWLMTERNFVDFEITHFLRYKFVHYWNSYLTPLLQKRHQQKKDKNILASTINKLIQNSHYGRQGMESSNYDQTLLTTGANLCRIRKTRLGHLSAKNLSVLGIVRLKRPAAKQKSGTPNQKKKRKMSTHYVDDEAEEEEEEEEEEKEEESDTERDARFVEKLQKLDTVSVLAPFSDVESDSDESQAEEEETGDLTENAVRCTELGEKKKTHYEYHFLYALTLSSGDKDIVNNLPGAVAVLSNSKRIFLGHINNMLVCSDPRLTELCYIDTDSCIFSMTYQNWDDCLLDSQVEKWNASRVMADESAEQSCHGQMKCEGLYSGGLFKTLKIYRLFDQSEEIYTRCKGVNRHLAEQLTNSDFDSESAVAAVVTRTCLRPSASGQILMTKESRSLSNAVNFKRKVTANGVHSFPISFVAEC